jgi:tetratricopeptide (TPR) repeat protein
VVLFFLAGLSAILGMFTKEVMVTVPLTVGAIEFILLPHPKRKGLRLKPAMFLSAGVVLFFLLLMKLLNYKMNDLFSLHPSESHDGDMITMGSYLLTEMRVFLTFLRLLVLPIHQSLDYNYSISKGILQPPLTLMGIGVITVMMVLVIKLRRRWPVIAFGLAWVLITFSINMVPRSNVIFEHKLYLISFGFFLAAVVFLSTVIRQQRILTGVLIAIIAVLAITCFERNLVWRNSLTLWEDEVSKSHKQRAYANLGQAYIEVARYQDALVILNKAIAMKPDDYISYYNRAVVYHHLGQYQSAYNDFSKVVSAKSDVTPLYVETLVNRSSLFVSTQQFGWAIQDLDRAQKADPGCVEVYKDRAYCLLKMGRRYESFGDFQSALRLDPDDTRLGLQYRSLLMYDAIEKTLGFNMESFRKVFAK